MAESVSAAAAVIQLVTIVPGLIEKFAQWHDLRFENQNELDHLWEDIKATQAMLNDFDSACKVVERNAERKPNSQLPANWNMIKRRVHTLQLRLKNLQNDCSRLKTPRRRDKLLRTLHHNKIKTLRDHFDKLDAAMADLSNALQSIAVPGASSDVPHELFVVVRDVPLNPRDVCLDFASMGENGAALTCEAQLKDAIFDQTDRRAVAAVVQGIGGVGKTCALQGIGLLEETQSAFSGGILYMVVGADGGLPGLVESIADIVERAGGKKEAGCIREKSSLFKATSLAGEWFRDHICLFLIDDIWCVNGITRESIHQLTALAGHPKSRIVFTTRDTKVGFGREIVFRERKPHGEQARAMLLKCADLPSPVTTDACTAFNKILGMCNGLPVALSVCGRAVREYAKRRCESHPADAWVVYWDNYKDRPVLSADSRDAGMRLKRSVLLSLDFIDEGRKTGVSRTRFTALCVLRKQQFVASDVMRRLWGVSECEAHEIIDDLERFSIVQVRCRDSDQKTLIGLHDVLLEISRQVARENKTLRHWCKTLVVSYNNERGSDISHCDGHVELVEGFHERFNEWWMQVDDDGYIFGNICWLLKEGEHYKTLLGLVCNPEWIVRQLRWKEHRQVVEGMQLAAGCLHKHMGADEKARFEEFLRLLQSAVEMSWKEVHESLWDGMGFFQLYGRMVHVVERNEYVERFLEEVETAAPRPWLRPSAGCLPAAGGALRHVIDAEGEILSFVQVAETVTLCYSDITSIRLKRYNMENRTETAAEVVFEGVDFFSHNCPTCAGFSSSGKQLAVGMDSGDVIVCQIPTHGAEIPEDQSDHSIGDMICSFSDISCRGSECEHASSCEKSSDFRSKYPHSVLPGHEGFVRSVGLNEDGRSVVCGTMDGTVSVWESDGQSWVESKLEKHQREVCSVAVSANAQQMISVSKDGAVRIWHRDGEKWIDTNPERHGWEGHGRVCSAAMSADGQQVVSGSADGTLEVWERDGTRWVDTELGRHGGEVCSVAVTADGQQVVSGSENGAVSVWERIGERWVDTKLETHMSYVNHVEMSTNGRQVLYSGSLGSYWKVMVWERGNEKCGSIEEVGGQGTRVRVMEVSADGHQVASYSRDGTIMVWERDGKKWVSTKVDRDTRSAGDVTLSTGGPRVVCGFKDGRLMIWERNADKWVRTETKGYTTRIRGVQMSADGQRMVLDLKGRGREMWGWYNGQWKEEREEERYSDLLNPCAERKWIVDDTLLQEVGTSMERFHYRETVFGYFIERIYSSHMAQLDFLPQ